MHQHLAQQLADHPINNRLQIVTRNGGTLQQPQQEVVQHTTQKQTQRIPQAQKEPEQTRGNAILPTNSQPNKNILRTHQTTKLLQSQQNCIYVSYAPEYGLASPKHVEH
jgi:hypothetical protein